jgi:hypothetical protein
MSAVPQQQPEQDEAPPAERSSEQRRPSVLVVAMAQQRGDRNESRGAARAARVAVEQARLTLMAFGLGLAMLPLSAALEPLVLLFVARALPGFETSAPCQGLLTDRRNTDLVFMANVSMVLGLIGVVVAACEVTPRIWRYLLHSLVLCPAAAVACTAWYASGASTPSAPQKVFASWFLSCFIIAFVPHLSFAASGLATAKRRKWRRAAVGFAVGVAMSAVMVILGVATAFYVILSAQVSGSAGVAINGKGWLSAGAREGC